MMSVSERMRQVPWSEGAADVQLAAGLALLEGVAHTGVPAMRWFRTLPAALLLGSSQRLQDVDQAACAAAGVAVHRRASGGGAVLCNAALLMLDVALPQGHRLLLSDVTLSYRWLGEVWAAALRMLGVPAAPIAIDEARSDALALDAVLKRVCFGGRSPFEVLAGGHKVVGLAQIRRRGGALLQSALYVRWDPWQTAALIAASASERAVLAERLALRVAGFDQVCSAQAMQVRAAVEAACVRHAGLQPMATDWEPIERDAQAAALARYAPLGL